MSPGELDHPNPILLLPWFGRAMGGQQGGEGHILNCMRSRQWLWQTDVVATTEPGFFGVSFSRADKSVRRFSRDDLDRELNDEGVFSWIDVQGGDISVLNDLLKRLELNLRLVSHFDDPEILPRIVERPESLAFYLYEVEDPEKHLDTSRGISAIELDRMVLVLSTEYVITYHRRQMDVVDVIKASCENAFRLAGKSPAFIAFLFIERCLYDCAHLNLANDNAPDVLDSKLVLGDSASAQQGLNEVAGNILTLKKLAASLHIVLMLLGTKRSRFVSAEAKSSFQEILGNALAVRGSVDSSRDLLDGVLASIQAASANKTNEVMRVLTVMSGILLPLSLIAGIYGMNFENMPELHQPRGYFAVLGVMGVVAVALLLAFRRAGFIGRQK
jgi:magnesium transporter